MERLTRITVTRRGHVLFEWSALIGDHVAKLAQMSDEGMTAPGDVVQFREPGDVYMYQVCEIGWNALGSALEPAGDDVVLVDPPTDDEIDALMRAYPLPSDD